MDLSLFIPLINFIFLYVILNAGTGILKTISAKSYREEFSVSGKGKPSYSPPAAPDPYKTAAAQSTAERQSARANALLLNPSIQSPYGNVNYDTNQETFGKDIIRRPAQTVTLSPSQQREFDQRNQISEALNSAGVNLAQRMPDTELRAPQGPARPQSFDFSGVDRTPNINAFQADRQRVEDSIYNRGLRLLKPQLDQQEKALRERLVQTGNPLGSEAYNTEFTRFDQGRNNLLQNLADDAVAGGGSEQNRLFDIGNLLRNQQLEDVYRPYQGNQMLRNDQLNEDQLLRNQQINELAALLQGREAISSPQAGYNQAALRAPDIAGLVGQNYGNQLNSYNQQYQANQARRQGRTSGLFGIGAALAGPALGFALGGPAGAGLGASLGGASGGFRGLFGGGS